jgi:AraC-like DNA-binding protein
MQRVEDARALYASDGRYLLARAFLVARPTPGVQWVAAWGRLAEPDLAAFLDVLAAEADAAPHVSLIDLRRLEGVDAPAVARLAEFMGAERAAQKRVTLRQAMVRPPGYAGVVVAGFWQVYAPPYDVAIFDEVHPALLSLGLADDPAIELARACEELVLREERDAALITPLRAWLAESLQVADEASAARCLGMSVRTLQRKLHAAGTSFGKELVAARMRVAMTALAETDRTLKEIALDVGIPSASQFSTVFRREVGKPPGAWRADWRARRDGAE